MSWGQWVMHDMLTLDAKMDGDSAGFLAIVYPVAAITDGSACGSAPCDGAAGDGSAGDGSAGDGSAGDGSAGDGAAGEGAAAGDEPVLSLVAYGDGLVAWQVERTESTDYVISNRTGIDAAVVTPDGDMACPPGLSIVSIAPDGTVAHSLSLDADVQ